MNFLCNAVVAEREVEEKNGSVTTLVTVADLCNGLVEGDICPKCGKVYPEMELPDALTSASPAAGEEAE